MKTPNLGSREVEYTVPGILRVLGIESGWQDNLAHVKRKKTLSTVLSVFEVHNILEKMEDTPKLMAELIYGTGMRVNECAQLRVKDIGFDLKTIMVRHGKGGKDRTTLLPVKPIVPLRS